MLTITGTLDSVKAVSTTNLAADYSLNEGPASILTSTGNLALAVDGYAAVVNDRILVTGQTNKHHNGIYIVEVAGSSSEQWRMTRAADFRDDNQIIAGMLVFVTDGAANGDTSWIVNGSGSGAGGSINFNADTDLIVFAEATTVAYVFEPTTNVFVVQAATFGIGRATVTSVSSTQTGANPVSVSYSVTYTNVARNPATVSSTLVFGTIEAALAYYSTVIS